MPFLTGFSWCNSWGFHGENPMKKHEKSHENALKNSQLMAHESSSPKSNTLKIHENAIKFYGVMKCNLMGFSCFGKNTP